MNTSQTMNLLVNPLATWTRLAWKTGEMAIASAQVIAHRTSRLAMAGAVPSLRDQRELTVMGQEKGAAAVESAQAVWARLLSMNQQFAALAVRQMFSISAGLMSIAASRTPAESAGRQSKLVRDTMTNSAVTASKLSGATAQLAHVAARPIHTRIGANARRLRKRRA